MALALTPVSRATLPIVRPSVSSWSSCGCGPFPAATRLVSVPIMSPAPPFRCRAYTFPSLEGQGPAFTFQAQHNTRPHRRAVADGAALRMSPVCSMGVGGIRGVWMLAQFVPALFLHVNPVVFSRLLDVGEGQVAVGIRDVFHLIEARQRVLDM